MLGNVCTVPFTCIVCTLFSYTLEFVLFICLVSSDFYLLE
jgi:hypothetical protein